MTLSRKRSPRPATATPPSSAARNILDIAERLAQTRGYNGFSYADIAEQLGVTKASLHYHFASKAELGLALVARYHAAFSSMLQQIDLQTSGPAAKLRRYVDIYDAVIRDDRMCLCGMLAAEFSTLPTAMQKRLKLFFNTNERWLTGVLAEGERVGSFVLRESAVERAQVLLGALEGAMLVARSFGDPRRFRTAADHLLASLGTSNSTGVRHSARSIPRHPHRRPATHSRRAP